MAYYILTENDYDTYQVFIFEGPEVENWKEFIKSLEKEAVPLALAKEKIWWEKREKEYPQYKSKQTRELTYNDVVFEFLLPLIESKGYKRVWFDEAKYFSSDTVNVERFGLSLE